MRHPTTIYINDDRLTERERTFLRCCRRLIYSTPEDDCDRRLHGQHLRDWLADHHEHELDDHHNRTGASTNTRNMMDEIMRLCHHRVIEQDPDDHLNDCCEPNLNWATLWEDAERNLTAIEAEDGDTEEYPDESSWDRLLEPTRWEVGELRSNHFEVLEILYTVLYHDELRQPKHGVIPIAEELCDTGMQGAIATLWDHHGRSTPVGLELRRVMLDVGIRRILDWLGRTWGDREKLNLPPDQIYREFEDLLSVNSLFAEVRGRLAEITWYTDLRGTGGTTRTLGRTPGTIIGIDVELHRPTAEETGDDVDLAAYRLGLMWFWFEEVRNALLVRAAECESAEVTDDVRVSVWWTEAETQVALTGFDLHQLDQRELESRVELDVRERAEALGVGHILGLHPLAKRGQGRAELRYRLSAPDSLPPPDDLPFSDHEVPEGYWHNAVDAVYHAICHIIGELRVTLGEGDERDRWEWRPRGGRPSQWRFLSGEYEDAPVADIMREIRSHRRIALVLSHLEGFSMEVWEDVCDWLAGHHLHAPVHMATGCWILPALAGDKMVAFGDRRPISDSDAICEGGDEVG